MVLFNAGFSNSNSKLDHCVPEPHTSDRYANETNPERSEQTHFVDIHRENEYQSDLNMNPSTDHAGMTSLPVVHYNADKHENYSNTSWVLTAWEI